MWTMAGQGEEEVKAHATLQRGYFPGPDKLGD